MELYLRLVWSQTSERLVPGGFNGKAFELEQKIDALSRVFCSMLTLCIASLCGCEMQLFAGAYLTILQDHNISAGDFKNASCSVGWLGISIISPIISVMANNS